MKRHASEVHGIEPVAKMSKVSFDVAPGSDSAQSDQKDGQVGELDDVLIDSVMNINADKIATRHVKSGRRQDQYNFATKTVTLIEVKRFLHIIFEQQNNRFKLNAAVGSIMEDVRTGQLAYYYASMNTRLFPKPVFVRRRADLNKFMSQFEAKDILEHCRQERTNTKWVVRKVRNILFYVDKIEKHRIGIGRGNRLRTQS